MAFVLKARGSRVKFTSEKDNFQSFSLCILSACSRPGFALPHGNDKIWTVRKPEHASSLRAFSLGMLARCGCGCLSKAINSLSTWAQIR